MYSDNKQIRDVADAAAKIMYGQQTVTEKLHPNQQVLDVHEPEKDELTADDFKKLRAKKSGVVKEDDTGYQDRFAVKNGKAVKHNPEKGEHDEPHHVWADSPEHAVRKHAQMNKPKTEQVEELDEVKMADLPSTKVQGRSYGSSRPEPHAVDVMKGPKEKELKDIEAEKKKKKFSEMVNLYQEKGLKSLSEMLVKEEPDNEQFTKELEDAKAKNDGKKKNTEIAKGAVQAVKNESTDDIETTRQFRNAIAAVKARSAIDKAKDGPGAKYYHDGAKVTPQETARRAAEAKAKKDKKGITKESTEQDIYVIDADLANGVNQIDIEERHMTDDEMEKREKIVKSMKKGMAGFKDRYGDRAKNVMYATANKQAMKD